MTTPYVNDRFTVGLDHESSQRVIREATILGLPQSVVIRNYVKKGFLYDATIPGAKLI